MVCQAFFALTFTVTRGKIEDMETDKVIASPAKKRGPVKQMDTRGFTVMLPDDLGEWGKNQPGGLSQLVREVLQRVREESEHKEK